jgi:hypothetical protein
VLLLLDWSVTTTVTIEQEERVKSREEIMNILEAFDLTGSFRDAGELAGCSHHTVAAWVAKRDAGELPEEEPARRERMIDPLLPKIEELGGAQRRPDPGRCRVRQAAGAEVRRVGAHGAPSGGGGEGEPSPWPAAGVSAVDP